MGLQAAGNERAKLTITEPEREFEEVHHPGVAGAVFLPHFPEKADRLECGPYHVGAKRRVGVFMNLC